jgi:hypothetical protein
MLVAIISRSLSNVSQTLTQYPQQEDQYYGPRKNCRDTDVITNGCES